MFYQHKRHNKVIVEVLSIQVVKLSYIDDEIENAKRNVAYVINVFTGREYEIFKDVLMKDYVHIPEEDLELALLANVY